MKMLRKTSNQSTRTTKSLRAATIALYSVSVSNFGTDNNQTVMTYNIRYHFDSYCLVVKRL
jgi:hypothetical protein